MPRPIALLLAVGLLAAWLASPGRAEEEKPPLDEPSWWLDKAAELTRALDHPDGQAALLVSIAAGRLEADEEDAARVALAEAASFARRCEGCFGKVRRLTDVALMQQRAGDEEAVAENLALARRAADQLDGADRAEAVAHVAGALAEVGDEEGATDAFTAAVQAVARLGPEDRAYQLIALAMQQAAAGRVPDARRSLARAPTSVPAGDPDARADVKDQVEQTLAWIAEAAAANGDGASALQTITAIRDPYWLAWAYHDVAAALGKCRAAATALEKAVKSAKGIEFPSERLALLVAIARTASEWGVTSLASHALGKAAQAAAEVQDTREQATGLLGLAAAWAAAGNTKRAVEAMEAARKTVDQTFTRRERPEAFLALTRAEAALGRFEEARAAAREIGDPERIGDGWSAIAAAQLARGDAPRAVVTLEELERVVQAFPADLEKCRDEALRQAAVLYAKAGELDEAARLVDVIKTPFHAATACTYIASALSAR